MLVAGYVFFDLGSMGPLRTVLVILIMLFAIVAHAPLGFILGTLNRGLYANLVLMLVVLVLFITSGVPFPLDILPRWVQVIQLALLTFWTGHLTRWASLPAEAGMNEVVGGFMPLVGVGVLVLWLILGLVVATFLVGRFFRHESIGTVSKMQASVRSQMGV